MRPSAEDRPPEAAPLLLLRIAAFPFESLAPLTAGRSAETLAAVLDLEADLDTEAVWLGEALYTAAGEGAGAQDEAGAGQARDAGSAHAARGAIIALRRALHNRRPVAPALLAAAAPHLESRWGDSSSKSPSPPRSWPEAPAGNPGESFAAAQPRRQRGPARSGENFPGETPGPGLAAEIEAHLARRREAASRREELRATFRADLARGRAALLDLAGRPLFREGLRLVSRSLAQRVSGLARAVPSRRRDEASTVDGAAWLAESHAGASQVAQEVALAARDLAREAPFRLRHDERHALAKLAAYAARFTTKTSPNSVFCATALARFVAGAPSVTGENLPARRDFLLSVAEARKVAACLGADRAAWPAVVPRLNPTLRRSPEGVWTFWRTSSPRREDDLEVLSRVREQPALAVFLEEAARGLPVPELLARAAGRTGLPAEDLAGFLDKLGEAGILIVEIEPPYGERHPLAFLAHALRSAGCEPSWLTEIEAVEREVDTLASLGTGDRLAALDAIEDRFAALPHRRPLKRDELFRVDVASGIDVALPVDLLAGLEEPVRRYVQLFTSLYPERSMREAWARKFLSRHPTDTEVPLLDLYHGLFEPEPLERPAAFPEPLAASVGDADGTGETPSAILRRVERFFAERARAASAAGAEEVHLGKEDWDHLLGSCEEPAWSAGVLFQVAARDPQALAAGDYRIVLDGLFAAGVALARFAHLHRPEGRAENPIAREVAAAWSPLARPGAILAEVTYTHMGRSANAGLRPATFRHEIELPGERASREAEAIPLSDLAVRWDSAASRFVLRSLSRDAEVVPVLSSGINPEGFVSFLVEIGRQGLQPLAWFPGFDVPGVTRWPRFTDGRLVLFRRRWVFAPGEGPDLPRESRDPDEAAASFFEQVARWRRDHGIPRHVFVHTTADPKPFYADLDSPLSTELLRRALIPARNAGSAAPSALHVSEMLPGPEDLWVSDAQGRYATEFLVQMRGPARESLCRLTTPS